MLKPSRVSFAAPLALLLTLPRGAAGQGTPAARAYRATWVDVATLSVAGTAAALPLLFKLPHGAPSCAPCSPAGLSGIDRWVVGANSSLARGGSDALLLGVGGLAAVAAIHDRSSRDAWGNVAMFANTVGWTSASTQWIKVLARRKRPVLYTSGAAAAAADRDNQQSFPSGHTALAFAVATSYLVMAEQERLPHRTRNTALLYTGAAGVGALRIAGGRHFPTDVLAGAALGSGVGWLIARLHPRTP